MTAGGLILQGTPTQRLPVSVIGSIGLHAAAFALFMYTATAKKETTRVIGNVDLLIQVKKPVERPAAQPKQAAPPSTWNFLKMALPAAPKLQQLNVKVPERKAMMTAQPKLDERARRDMPKLESLDLDQKRPELSALSAKIESRRESAAKLAALPKLEEVGRRQVRNLPQALKLEEQRQQALGLQQMDALSAAPPERRAAATAPMGEPLRDSGQAQASRFADKIASMLPSGGLSDRPMAAQAPAVVKQVVSEPMAKRAAAQAITETKKGVTIEGQLSNRKVVGYDVPTFPKWARDQGVLEAEVAIRFWVNGAGDVLPNMRVEHTSGYGRLDRLAMDALKNWKFEPISKDERQWGVITFRFVLE